MELQILQSVLPQPYFPAFPAEKEISLEMSFLLRSTELQLFTHKTMADPRTPPKLLPQPASTSSSLGLQTDTEGAGGCE